MDVTTTLNLARAELATASAYDIIPQNVIVFPSAGREPIIPNWCTFAVGA